MDYFFTDYNWIESFVHSKSKELRALGITDIVAISRGGIFPAILSAYELDVMQIHLLNYDRNSAAIEWQGHSDLNSKSVVLLCEDVAGDGRTLTDCVAYLKTKTPSVFTLAISHFDGSAVRPDFGYYSGEVITIFPWERHSINPEVRAGYRNHRKRLKNDTAYFKFGTDLDGIFLPDIDDHLYQNNLEQALMERAALTPYDSALYPPIVMETTAIITGRPSCDANVTAAWLRAHGIAFAKLLMRDETIIAFADHDDHYTKTEKSAYAKSQHIKAEGITHFYESDPLQAMLLSNMLPMVRVYWWNNARMVRKLVSISDAD